MKRGTDTEKLWGKQWLSKELRDICVVVCWCVSVNIWFFSPLVCSSWTRGSGRLVSSWTVHSRPVGWQAVWRWRLVLSATQTYNFSLIRAAHFIVLIIAVIIISIIVIIQDTKTGAGFWLDSRLLDPSGMLLTTGPASAELGQYVAAAEAENRTTTPMSRQGKPVYTSSLICYQRKQYLSHSACQSISYHCVGHDNFCSNRLLLHTVHNNYWLSAPDDPSPPYVTTAQLSTTAVLSRLRQDPPLSTSILHCY